LWRPNCLRKEALRTMKGTLSLVALALVLALASCGGGSSGGGGGGSGSSDGTKGRVIKTVAIKETELDLSPSTVVLSKPGTYAIKAENKGSAEHSLEIEGKGVSSKGGEVGEAKLEQTLNPGQSAVLTVTFQEPGTYEMYCPIDGHKELGMKGEVVVE
jgi:uncharacterized cupredoxin-like copper-binding protein